MSNSRRNLSVLPYAKLNACNWLNFEHEGEKLLDLRQGQSQNQLEMIHN